MPVILIKLPEIMFFIVIIGQQGNKVLREHFNILEGFDYALLSLISADEVILLIQFLHSHVKNIW